MKHVSTSFVCSSVLLGLFVAACGSGSSSGGSAGGGNTTGTGATGGAGAGGAGTGGGSGATGGTSSSCIEGQQQCSGDTPQKCVNGTWQSGTACPAVCSAGACIGTCKPGATQCNGNIPQTCDAAGNWTDGPACPLACTNGSCGAGTGSCTPGEKKCKLDLPQTCDASGKWQNGAPCPAGCELGACKEVCKAGEFNCYGNEIQQCDPGPPAKWIPKTPATVCSPTSGTTCDKKTGTCIAPPTLGTTTPTGTYYQYATLNSAAGYLGGYDVDSYEDKIYVNRSGANLDVYQVTLLDSDGDGKLEPDQHPSNNLSPGPVEQRTLKLLKTYTRTTDKAPLGGASVSELFALSDRVFSLGTSTGTKNGGVTEYIFNGLVVNQVFLPVAQGLVTMSHLGFGDNDGVWYGSNEGARRVYSYHAPTKAWVVEFNYPNLAGSHMDGLEVIVSPKTGEQYVYVSDMTSDFLGQYRKDPTGWTQVNLFKYTDGTGQSLEGMGFGAFNHFWATGGVYLYEIGGGDLAQFVE